MKGGEVYVKRPKVNQQNEIHFRRKHILMKRKFFRVLIALVLVVSFSLVTAVPVMAVTPTISYATYDHTDGNLVLTGAHFDVARYIDATALTITGEGGATYTLTALTDDVQPSGATAATFTLLGADKTGVEGLLNKDGTSSIGGTTYNLAAAAGWHTAAGGNAITTVGINVANAAPVILSAAYDHTDGNLVLTGTDFNNTDGEIDATTLTITGEGGATYTLTAATANVTPASATEATIVVAGADKTEVDALLNKDVLTAIDGTTYNLAAAADWHIGDGGIAIATIAITVSNAPVPDIASATYDHDTGNLVLTGTYFYTGGEIGATTLTITGEGTAAYTLTVATANVTPASATEATIVVAGADKTEVDALLNKDGTTSVDATDYNLDAAAGWHGDIGESADATIGITVSNATIYDQLITLNPGWTLFSTDNYIISSGDNTSAWVGTPAIVYRHTGEDENEDGFPDGFLEATFTDLEPVEALYVNMPDGGWAGLNYDTDVIPGFSAKIVVEGWNLISSATADNASAVLSPLQYVQVGEQQGAGLATLVSQGNYNLSGTSLYLATLSVGDWETLAITTLDPFDGYWVYMNTHKIFGVFPNPE